MLNVTAIDKNELGTHQAFFSGNSFMQTLFWAEFKEGFGFKPIYFIVDDQGEKEGLILLIRPIFKDYSLAYIPHGPSNKLTNTKSLKELSKELKRFLPNKCLLIRYDLMAGTIGDEYPKPLEGLKKSASSIQVPDTTIVNLTRPVEDILKGMHKKTRYNIKLARKKGIEIREADITELDTWYNMYEITAKRDNIAIHSKKYYLSVYNKAKASIGVDMKLLFACYEGELLAGIFVLICGEQATYLYGASSNSKRNLMPAYLLQWSAIELVKNEGATIYDFFGIPPVNDKNHPMYGLYRFKTGFGGEIIHRLGCYDYIISPLGNVFLLAERLRNIYYKKIRKSHG